MKILWILLLGLIPFSASLSAADCWLSVSGSGKMDGTSIENAYSAKKGRSSDYAQHCWNQTSEDGTMYVLEGDYSIQNGAFWQLRITKDNDGSSDKKQYKRLIGLGDVHLSGPRPSYSPDTSSQGGTWIEIKSQASYVLIDHFSIDHVENGILATEGGNQFFKFKNLHFQDTRQNILIYGHSSCSSIEHCPIPREKLSRQMKLENITGIRYSKRHIRLGKGLSDVLVDHSYADAAYLDGDFAVGFDVENPAWNIEFRNSTARRNLYSGSEYWNGDGFKAENETLDIRWINCSAFDNADGGFDIKTKNAYMENILALRNSRNIRIWHSAELFKVNASFSKYHGGMGSGAGLWSKGKVDCHDCFLHNNEIQVHTETGPENAHVRLFDSLLSLTARAGETIRSEEKTKVELIRTTVIETFKPPAPLESNAPRNE